MMKIISKVVFIWICLLFINGYAAVSKWKLIPNESSISFTGTQNSAPASGSFKKFEAELAIDPDKLDASKVRIIVDMNSLATSYSAFKDTLITPEWFDVQKYPQAIFEATHFKKISDTAFQASGSLTIKNKSLPITIDFTTVPQSSTKGLAKGTVTINRLDYGVGEGQWADTSLVKNEVQVNFSIAAAKE